MADSRVLIGRAAIQDYLGISKARFMALVAGGLPAAKRSIGGRSYWLADKDLLDFWFKGLIVGVEMAPGAVFQRWLASLGSSQGTGSGRSIVFNPN